MNRITGEELESLIIKDPTWCSKLTKPTEVTTYCNLARSNITHLSPLLTFKGLNQEGDVADLAFCKNLKVATGTFYGYVSFSWAGIEKIENLEVKEPNSELEAASFQECTKLKIATGTYNGHVSFYSTAIIKIEDLLVLQPNKNGEAANFEECHFLLTGEGNYPGHVNFEASSIAEIKKLNITKPNENEQVLNISHCTNLTTVRGTFPGTTDATGSPCIQKGPKWLLNPKCATIHPNVKKHLEKIYKEKEIDLDL